MNIQPTAIYRCFNCGGEPNRRIEIRKQGAFGGKGKVKRVAYVCFDCWDRGVGKGNFPYGADEKSRIVLQPKKTIINDKTKAFLQKQKELADAEIAKLK